MTGDARDPVLSLAAESIAVAVEKVATGRVQVRTHTDASAQFVRQELHGTRVEVTRVAIGRTLAPGEQPPGVRSEDGVTIVPIFEEIVVVEKRLVLKEEVHITQVLTIEDLEIPVTLRTQRAVIERLPETNYDTNPSPGENDV